jgi:hypothetical protein
MHFSLREHAVGATLRYIQSMFEYAPKNLMMALLPGPVGAL